MQGFEEIYVGMLFSGYLKWEVLGAWMTFKKAEMAKTLENGLSMIETNPLNHNWSHFVILSGSTLHQYQKKLLLNLQTLSHYRCIIIFITDSTYEFECCKNTTVMQIKVGHRQSLVQGLSTLKTLTKCLQTKLFDQF